MEIADRAYRLEQCAEVQNCRFRQPGRNELHGDRHPILTSAEAHRQAGQTGCTKRCSSIHDMHGRNSLTVDVELACVMPVGGYGQHWAKESIVALEVLCESVAHGFDLLLGGNEVFDRSVGRVQY